MNRNPSKALTKSPIRNLLPFTVKKRAEKAGIFPKTPMMGVMRSLTSACTTPAKAAPITTATARSTTFPRRMNFLNPLMRTSCGRGLWHSARTGARRPGAQHSASGACFSDCRRDCPGEAGERYLAYTEADMERRVRIGELRYAAGEVLRRLGHGDDQFVRGCPA